MAIVDALNKVTGGHGSTIEEAVKNLSSGGGSDDNKYIVNITETWQSGADNPTVSADKTFDELLSAYNDDKDLVAVITSYLDGEVTDKSKSLYCRPTLLVNEGVSSIALFTFSVLSNDFYELFVRTYVINSTGISYKFLTFEAVE